MKKQLLTLLLVGIRAIATFGADTCSMLKDCSSCTDTTIAASSDCRWCGRCVSKLSAETVCKDSEIVRFDDTCHFEYPADASSELSDWMGNTISAIGNMTLLDLSLPGTHDTLTFDLSTIVSDGGADDMLVFAKIMHDYANVIPDSVEDFIRQQAQTQDLDVKQQLDNGIRFLDFRIMYEYSDPLPDWYSLHFVQSNRVAMEYLTSVRDWMTFHPSEIVVIWLSKHGGTQDVGEKQYPNTTIAEKQKYWGQIQSLFSGLLTDFSMTRINETSISDMIDRNHRVVIYASDYMEFTGNSSFALDASLIDNRLGPGLSNQPEGQKWERSLFSTATEIISANKVHQGFFLMSMATGVPAESTVWEAAIRFLPSYNESEVLQCAAAFNVPGLDWCPQTLLDIAQLENYYKQITLEEAFVTPGWGFPNAIYINAVDWEGTIRTGTRVLWGAKRSTDTNPAHETAAYAYVDTMILYNIRVGCAKAAAATKPGISKSMGSELADGGCEALDKRYGARRELFPKQLWTDTQFGRLQNWP